MHQKKHLINSFLLVIAFLNYHQCQIRLTQVTPGYSQGGVTPCDRYICRSWGTDQDLTDLRVTGISTNQGYCVVTTKQVASTGTGQTGKTNYYLSPCPFPKYTCTKYTPQGTTDANVVAACTLNSEYDKTALAYNHTQNKLWVGEWCLYNEDCATGLCDRKIQGQTNYVSNVTLPPTAEFNTTLANVTQQTTNKCFARKAGDPCTKDANGFIHHEQCDIGLRCVSNPKFIYEQRQTTPKTNYPPYVCMTTMSFNTACDLSNSLNTTVYATQTADTSDTESWERCQFGTECATLIKNATGNVQQKAFKCLPWFAFLEDEVFAMVSYGNGNYQQSGNNGNANGNWNNYNMKQTYEVVYNSVTFPGRMCKSYTTSPATITGTTAGNTQFTCKIGPQTQLKFGQQSCGVDTDCYSLGTTLGEMYGAGSQQNSQGTHKVGAHYCSCAFFNENGKGWCTGFIDDNLETGTDISIRSTQTQDFYEYFGNARFQNCYAYEIWNLYAKSNKTSTNSTQLCAPPYPTFYDPAKAALKGNCYNVIKYPSQVLSYDEIDAVETNIYNYKYLPSNRWMFAIPGVYELRADQQATAGYVYINGQCPKFMCQQILLDQYYDATVNNAFTSYDGLPAPKGACAYYSERNNVWSIQACRSPFDICEMCTSQITSSTLTTAQRSACRGYGLTQNNTNYGQHPDIYNTQTVQATEKVKAWKCQRLDHVLKRIYDYCWDNSDCLSGLCSPDGECYVLYEGQTCSNDNQCDKNLRCAYKNATDNSLTCQRAIAAGQECSIDTYSRCKVGSHCILVENQLFPTCVNMFSLPGRITFTFVDNMLDDPNENFYVFPSNEPTNTYDKYDIMCASGMYSKTQQNEKKFVDYIGCVDFQKKTRGGWPKECTDEGANSKECQSIQSFTYNQYNYVTNKNIDGYCRCSDSTLFNHDLETSGPQADWDRSIYNEFGIGYCQGFPGESDNSLLIYQRTYERDFKDCYPYEILKNAPLTSDATVKDDIQKGLITNWNWQFMPRLYSYAGGLIPYEYGVCGYLKPIYYDPQPMKPQPQCYNIIFKERRINRLDGTLYKLWSRCPQYVCQPTVDSNVCRQYDPVTNVVSLQSCPEETDTCSFYNSSLYLCNYNVTGGKKIGESCYLDQECKSQVCGARDVFGLPNMNLSGRVCQVQNSTESCVTHENCEKGLRCVYIYPGFIPQTNTTVQNPQFAAYKVTMQCMTALKSNDECNLTVPESCKYGSMCVQLYEPSSTTKTVLRCVNYYSLKSGTRIMEPVLASTQKLYNKLCATGYYYFDTYNTQQSWKGTPQQWQQYGSSSSGCQNRTVSQGFPSSCKSDSDCKHNPQLQSTDPGFCNCSYFNDNGNGFCNPFETDDQTFLIEQQNYYANNFTNCYPFDYLHEYGNADCAMPKWKHDNIYVPSQYTVNKSSCYIDVFMGLTDGTFQIQRSWQDQKYNNICPSYTCETLNNAICRQYSQNWNSTWILSPCQDANNICQRYNETLYLCVRADGKLKGLNEQCFDNSQCMSDVCIDGKCAIKKLNEPCVEHINCDQNLRCVYTNISFKEGLYREKYCLESIPAGLICTPLSYDQCRYGTTCGLIYGQQVGICIPWFSLPGGANLTILTNYSSYQQYGFHQSVQTMYSELCQSGLYDPVRGCLPQHEETAGGFPLSCQSDNDCRGKYYGMAGSCTCVNENELGLGYCIGFDGEGNNKTQTYFQSYQRAFTNCYPYEIDNYWSDDENCYKFNYTVYNSAPNQSIGNCYRVVGINPFNSVNSPEGDNYNTKFAGMLLSANIITIILGLLLFFLNHK